MWLPARSFETLIVFGRLRATMRRNDCDLLVLRSGISSSEYRRFLLFSSNARATASRHTHGTYTPYMVAGWRVNRTNGASAHEAYPTLRMFFFNNQCQIELHDFWKFRPFGCLRSLIAMGVTTRNPPIGLHQGACDTTRSGFGAWRTASGGLIW
jgi:hypothetical protein